MNESLAFKNHLPIICRNDLNGVIEPFAIITELKRVSNMLVENGFDTRYTYIRTDSGIGCMIDCEAQLPYDFSYPRPDVVLMLSCPAGKEGMQSLFFDTPVICITKQTGLINYIYKKHKDGSREIVYDLSKVIYKQF